MFTSPSQIICTVFGVKIYYYGVILALAILAGAVVSELAARRFWNFKKDVIIDLAPYTVLFGILGARIYYCLLNFNFYSKFPTEVFALRHGGISIHGAILGGFIGLLIYSYRHKISSIKLADICAVGLPLAQAIGRWGNFFNSEAFGYPTNLPWKIFIDPIHRPIPYQNYEYFHPTFLYESILDILIFLTIFFVVKFNLQKKDGNLALIYLILYSSARIFVEHFRIDSVLYIGRFPVAIVMSAGIICIALILLIINNLCIRKLS